MKNWKEIAKYTFSNYKCEWADDDKTVIKILIEVNDDRTQVVFMHTIGLFEDSLEFESFIANIDDIDTDDIKYCLKKAGKTDKLCGGIVIDGDVLAYRNCIPFDDNIEASQIDTLITEIGEAADSLEEAINFFDDDDF